MARLRQAAAAARQTFVKALRMLVIPLVFTSITLGIYQMGREVKVLGRIIVIAFAWFYTATGSCSCSAY